MTAVATENPMPSLTTPVQPTLEAVLFQGRDLMMVSVPEMTQFRFHESEVSAELM